MKPPVIGLIFGRLTVSADAGSNKFRCRLVTCSCICGNTITTALTRLKSGETQSCGCIKKELDRAKTKRIHALGISGMRTHGLYASPEYKVWCAMKRRCLKSNDPNFCRYGGRGIQVCERWLQFESFIADMGRRPSSKHTLERLDNDGHYEPGNCEWRTWRDQNHNKSNNRWITHAGRTMILSDWARELGVKPDLLCNRLKAGWTTAETVSIQPIPRSRRDHVRQ